MYSFCVGGLMELRNLRKQKKITQAQIAEYLNLSPVGYGNYETGKTEPNIETLIKIADFYGVSVDYVVGHNMNNGFGYLNEKETDLVKTFRLLSTLSQGKVLGYARALIMADDDYGNEK